MREVASIVIATNYPQVIPLLDTNMDTNENKVKSSYGARKAAGVKLGSPKGPGKSKLDKYSVEIVAFLKNHSSTLNSNFTASQPGQKNPGIY